MSGDTLALAGGTLNLNGGTTLNNLDVTAGTLNINGSGATLNTLNLAKGTLGGSGNIAVTSGFDWDGRHVLGCGHAEHGEHGTRDAESDFGQSGAQRKLDELRPDRPGWAARTWRSARGRR